MSGPQFSIRTATAADIPTLEPLIEQSVRQLQQTDYSPSQIDSSIGSIFGIDRQLINDGTYFVAAPVNARSQLVACGGWSFRRTLYGSDQLADRNDTLLDPAVDYAKIRAIFTASTRLRPRGLRLHSSSPTEQAAQAAGFCRFEMGSPSPAFRSTCSTAMWNATASSPLPNGELLTVVHMNKSLHRHRTFT